MSVPAADDFDIIRTRLAELKRERESIRERQTDNADQTLPPGTAAPLYCGVCGAATAEDAKAKCAGMCMGCD